MGVKPKTFYVVALTIWLSIFFGIMIGGAVLLDYLGTYVEAHKDNATLVLWAELLYLPYLVVWVVSVFVLGHYFGKLYHWIYRKIYGNNDIAG